MRARRAPRDTVGCFGQTIVQLAILDPGHFHAALLQKSMYPGVDVTVRVYAPAGPDLDDYLRRIEGYNARPQDPTRWRIDVYTGADYLDRFATAGRGDLAVIAGSNARKTEYLTRAVEAGYHTLADKPMVIAAADFPALVAAFAAAQRRGVLLSDIMTERHEITTILQKALSGIPSVFGTLVPGSLDAPAVTKESVHHFAKRVSGAPITRPAWFFDVAQQGEGLSDIATHLVDLVQWECFPGRALDYRHDIRILRARRWPTVLSPAQFEHVTKLKAIPDFLRQSVAADGNLHVYANGEIDYVVRGIHAKVSVLWNFEAPAGAGDTHFSVMRGTRANLVIRQGEAQGWQPTLYVEPASGVGATPFARELAARVQSLEAEYPGIDCTAEGGSWRIIVPARYHVGHEAHFAQVAAEFLSAVAKGALPEWEVPNLLAKYYTTTQALTIARQA
jgi:predicted dehydrogenase